MSWMFEKKGYFVVDKAAAGEDKLLEIVLSAGAEDMQEDEDGTRSSHRPRLSME